MDYLYISYTTKIYQLVPRYSLASVLLFDREYRKVQATIKFRGGAHVNRPFATKGEAISSGQPSKENFLYC